MGVQVPPSTPPFDHEVYGACTASTSRCAGQFAGGVGVAKGSQHVLKKWAPSKIGLGDQGGAVDLINSVTTPGKTQRLVAGDRELDDLFARLTAGQQRFLIPGTDLEQYANLPDGTRIQLRNVSRSGKRGSAGDRAIDVIGNGRTVVVHTERNTRRIPWWRRGI